MIGIAVQVKPGDRHNASVIWSAGYDGQVRENILDFVNF